MFHTRVHKNLADLVESLYKIYRALPPQDPKFPVEDLSPEMDTSLISFIQFRMDEKAKSKAIADKATNVL